MSNKYNENNASISHCDCRALFCPRRCSLRPPQKYALLCESNALFAVFERRRGWGKEVFVNEGEHAGGRETACGLAAGVPFGLQYAELQRIAWWLRAGDGC